MATSKTLSAGWSNLCNMISCCSSTTHSPSAISSSLWLKPSSISLTFWHSSTMSYTYVQPHIAYPFGTPLSIQSHWMGCFTQDMKICDDLFHAGVPVWLIHSQNMITSQTNIKRHVKFTFPDEIICSCTLKVANPFTLSTASTMD